MVGGKYGGKSIDPSEYATTFERCVQAKERLLVHLPSLRRVE